MGARDDDVAPLAGKAKNTVGFEHCSFFFFFF